MGVVWVVSNGLVRLARLSVTVSPLWEQLVRLGISRAIGCNVTKIRPEQRGHKALLRRGRTYKRFQYTLLVLAAAAAGITAVAAITLAP